jgi:hypothetical protein
MRPALQRRPGPVAAAVAFLAALSAPFRILLRADIVGPLGSVPQLVPELLVPLVAPGLAVVAGARLAQAGERPSAESLTGRVGVGALVGAAVGFPTGAVLGRSLVSASTGPVALHTSLLSSLGVVTSLVVVLPITVATVVGIVAGIAWVCRPETPPGSLDRGDLGVIAVVVGCGLLAGVSVVFHQAATIAQSLDPGFLFSPSWTVLTVTGHVVLTSIVVPLVAVLGGWAGSDGLDRAVARTTVAGGFAATAVGMGVGYLVATTLGHANVGWFLRGSLPVLLVDGITVAAVLTLAALVGVALSPSRRAASRPTAA